MLRVNYRAIHPLIRHFSSMLSSHHTLPPSSSSSSSDLETHLIDAARVGSGVLQVLLSTEHLYRTSIVNHTQLFVDSNQLPSTTQLNDALKDAATNASKMIGSLPPHLSAYADQFQQAQSAASQFASTVIPSTITNAVKGGVETFTSKFPSTSPLSSSFTPPSSSPPLPSSSTSSIPPISQHKPSPVISPPAPFPSSQSTPPPVEAIHQQTASFDHTLASTFGEHAAEPHPSEIQKAQQVPETTPSPSSSTTTPPSENTPPTPSSSAASSSDSSLYQRNFNPRERSVPSSSLGRLIGFGGVAMRLAVGTIGDVTKQAFGINQKPSTPVNNNASSSSSNSSSDQSKSEETARNVAMNAIISEANAERLAEGLCRMRGAALKVGQMLSIQDDSLLPPQLQSILERVRDRADVMPRKQLEKALTNELGADWGKKLKEFDWQPMAAASIGQVHRALLHDGRQVVMKVQYPGVADSIDSDINNLKRLIRFVNVLPKGLYIEETMKAAKEELSLECDYSLEAEAQMKYKELIAHDKAFHVPAVIPFLSTKRILTTEMIRGLPIDKLAPGGACPLDQDTRNKLSASLLRLCLKELFQFRFMQTDPNWSNFLYDPDTNLVHLIDFGASRQYQKSFVDDYLRMVYAYAHKDRDAAINYSVKLGFLTGDESNEMMNAHVEAGFIIGEPFASDSPYDFVSGNIAARVSKLAAIMLRYRLTAPPKEAYTLHRKLSGAFLTCRKLEAKIASRKPFMDVFNNYTFG